MNISQILTNFGHQGQILVPILGNFMIKYWKNNDTMLTRIVESAYKLNLGQIEENQILAYFWNFWALRTKLWGQFWAIF